jgi:hypothetical protein
MQYTQEQILKLAPDSSSASAGSKLATPAKWVAMHAHKQALWGDCQGSGKNPYKTKIDLQNIAFKCSCPSRKFPCKHGLGLFLLYAKNPDIFSKEENLSDEVAEWLNKRTNRAETTQVKKDKPVDEVAQQKRITAREKKIQAGIEELQVWLQDVVRTGIMNVPQNHYQFTKNIAARMVDSQATGLANQLKEINKINFYEEGWQKFLLKQLAKTYTLTEAYQNIANLPEDLQEDIKTLIGWNIPKEQILEQPAITDEWLVLSKTLEEENNLTTEKIWLYGSKSKRFALILNFYAMQQKPSNLLTEGLYLEAELCFYPSISPLRALIKSQSDVKSITEIAHLEGQNIAEAANYRSEQWIKMPFNNEIPLLLSEVSLAHTEGDWALIDSENNYLSIHNSAASCWQTMAVSEGKKFTCFGLYQESSFQIHSILINQKFYFVL